jgi:hypothetical protein
LRRRTVDLYRLWNAEPSVPLQKSLTASAWNKHALADLGLEE